MPVSDYLKSNGQFFSYIMSRTNYGTFHWDDDDRI